MNVTGDHASSRLSQVNRTVGPKEDTQAKDVHVRQYIPCVSQILFSLL